jgi:ABC-type Fe3+-siderophore transport system permease subunit
VHPVILWTVVGVSLLLSVVGLALSLLNRMADRLLLGLAGLAEVTVIVQSVVAGIGLAGGHTVRSSATFTGYLVGTAIVLPFAVAWAWSDRNRWSPSVVAIGGVTVAVMTARLLMMWQGRA